MNVRDPAEHLAAVLVRAEALRKEPTAEVEHPPRFTIALSREVGARGTSVARELSSRLGWPVYDHELLERLAQELDVTVAELTHLDERPGHWLLECMEGWAAQPHTRVSEPAYFRRLLKSLLALGAEGQCIIVGRGAVFALSPARTLRVRLLASLADRVAVMSRELGLPPVEAAEYVARKDRERVLFLKDHFLRDPLDPAHYDLVVNMSRFSVSDCADVIMEALRRLQAHATNRGGPPA